MNNTNIYVPKSYRLLSNDNNILTLISITISKIYKLLDLLELEYLKYNTYYDRHQNYTVLDISYLNINNLELVTNIANTDYIRKIHKNFNKQEHEEFMKRIQIAPEYLFSYYKYLTSIIFDALIKTSKFIKTQNDKNNLVKSLIDFIAKDINDKSKILIEIDKLLVLILTKTIVI